MVALETEDKSGHLVAERDIDDAIGAVEHATTRIVQIMQAGMPALAVNVPNILRCLRELRAIRKHLAAQIPKEGP